MQILKHSTSQRLSLTASTSIAIIFSVVYGLLSIFIFKSFNWAIFVITNVVLFATSYIIYRLILDQFIYEKIKLIYKTIYELKSPKGSQKAKIFKSKDIIKETNQEVLQWAQDKKEEIEALKKLEAYRRDFLGNVSHELKTPIFNIQGYTMTLLEGGIDDPAINRKYLQRTEKSIDRMISMIEDLEIISRLEAGELKMNFKNFDLVELTKEVIEFMEIKAQNKNIKIFFAKDYEKPINVYADRQRMQHVLANLISNSIKYNEDGGTCKISFFDMDENILTEITDDGKGIPRKELPRVFERFYRGDKSRTRQGTEGSGLGLAIVKHVIEAHNQTINVRSTEGVGTTFAFTLKKA
ncbi:MAG: HAMP domain-containing sensor histidine kinase [Bacteroidales bacterium]